MISLNTLKDLSKLFQEAGKIDEYKQILDMVEKNMGLQEELYVSEKKRREAETKIEGLETRLELKENYEFKEFAMFKKNSSEGPVCQSCFYEKSQPIHLMKTNEFWFKCGSCGKEVCKDHAQYDRYVLSSMNTDSEFDRFAVT